MWKRHRRFAGDGTWDKVLGALLAQADAAGDLDWTVSVDSTINRAVDGRGRPLAVIVAPGQGHDGKVLADLLEEIRVPRLGVGRPRTTPGRALQASAGSSRSSPSLVTSEPTAPAEVSAAGAS